MVGAVIFTAANANYVRSINEKKNQQAYLVVSSAADVFVDSVAGDRVTFIKSVTTKDDVLIEDGTPSDWQYVDINFATPINLSNPNPTEEDLFKTVLVDMVKERYSNSESEIIRNFTIKTVIDEVEQKINAKASLENYDLKVVFSNVAIDDSDKNIYYLTVIIPFVRDKQGTYDPVIDTKIDITNDEEGNKITTSLYKIEWDAANVSVIKGDK